MLVNRRNRKIENQNEKCIIVGTHHNLEYKDKDTLEKGKNQIYKLLNGITPNLIVIESGYWWNRLNDCSGLPANHDYRKRVGDNHWAVIWGRDNKTRVILADLEERLKAGTSEEMYRLKREHAISEKVLRAVQDGYKKVILFCGKEHVSSIKKMIEEQVEVNVKYINKE